MYTDDVQGSYRAEDRQSASLDYTFYVKDLYVGDAPQFQAAYALSLFPTGGLYMRLVGKTFGKHYADYDPFSRTRPTPTRASSPGVRRDTPSSTFTCRTGCPTTWRRPSVATSSSSSTDSTSWTRSTSRTPPTTPSTTPTVTMPNVPPGRKNHMADDAEVFLGYPRSFNFGFQIFH